MPSGYSGSRDNDPPLRRTGAPGGRPVEGRPVEGRPVEGRSVEGHPAEVRPADGLRAQPLTDDVFGEYHTRRKEGGSSFGLIAGVVIGVAVVAGLGWYMWSTGALAPSAQDGTPQVVKANPDPYKVKPENPGGMQVENQDKLVYDRVARGEAPPRVENLLPAPEEPKAPPKPAAEPPPAPAETAALESAKPEPAKPEPAKPEPEAAKPEAAKPAPAETATAAAKPAEPAKPAPPPVQAAKTEPAKPSAPAQPEQDPLAAAVLAATGGRQAATGPITTKPGVPAESAAPAAAAPAPEPPTQLAAVPPAAPPAAVAGAFQIQLASARSEEGAMGEWNRIVTKNKETLAGLTPNVARVDLGEKGVFFRLRAGPLRDKAAADSLCAALGAQNVGCIVVRP